MEIKEVLQKMTLKEKIELCSGKDTWTTKAFEQYGIPSLFMCDGPSGLRKQEKKNATDMLGVNDSRKATCFPLAVTNASSWDEELMQQLGKAIGQEAKDQKVGMVLGPGVNIKRNPLCGRNFEYFSEDPYLAGKIAAGFIKGIESEGVACSMKHFACNSQENDRLNNDGIIDERTLREIYLKAFEIAVKEAKPSTLMSSYPKINGVHSSDNKMLLNDILREEWGFDGLVVTDWGGMNDRIAAMKAGNDLMMPGGSDYMEKELIKAVEEGRLSEEDIDKCAGRVIKLAIKEAEVLKEEYVADYKSHHKLAVKIAEGGAVLLKNEDNVLPTTVDNKTLVVGYMAKDIRYQGAGSSHVNPMDLRQPIEFLSDCKYVEGCNENGDTSEEMLKEIAIEASKSEKVIVFAGLPPKYESEGFDRDNMLMPAGHIRMIEEAAKNNSNVIVVLMCGSAVECDWADKVKAILYMGLAGEGSAEAIYNLVTGKANPSGRLSESWPYKYNDCVSASYYDKTKDALYMEGIYVGYRYYDKAEKAVRWPFGYGLSYTEFDYENLSINGNEVSFEVINTGDKEGSEVVQLYVENHDVSAYRPVRELKHFTKVFLKPNERKTIKFTLIDDDFSIWDKGNKVIGGDYLIRIGKNSREFDLQETFHVVGATIEQCDDWYSNCKGNLTQQEWEEKFNISYHEVKPVKGQYTMDNSIVEMMDSSLFMKIMYKAVEKVISKGFGGKADYDDPNFRMMINASAGGPLRLMHISGGTKNGLLEGVLEIANGHFFKGIATMIKG